MSSANTDRGVPEGGPQAQVYDGRIRPAHPGDRAWLIPLSVRLHESGRFPWRSRVSIDRAVALSLERVLSERGSDADIRVAEDPCGEPLGFAIFRPQQILQAKSTHTSLIWWCVRQRRGAGWDPPCSERLSCGRRNGSIGS
jgi:hypothetical protein